MCATCLNGGILVVLVESRFDPNGQDESEVARLSFDVANGVEIGVRMSNGDLLMDHQKAAEAILNPLFD